jgi:hypothetical protein
MRVINKSRHASREKAFASNKHLQGRQISIIYHAQV